MERSNIRPDDKHAQASFATYWIKNKPMRQVALAQAKQTIQRKGWLTLWGPYGNGKSELGVAIANECLRVGLSAIHYDMADLLDFLRAGYGADRADNYERRFDDLTSAYCLVVDECNAFNASGWALEKFRQVSQARYRACNTTVTVWILNAEPRLGNPEIHPDMEFLVSRMQEFSICEMSDGDLRPGISEKEGRQ